MRSAVEGISGKHSPAGKPPLPGSSSASHRQAVASAAQEEGLRQSVRDAEMAAESMRIQLAEAREGQQRAMEQLQDVQVGHPTKSSAIVPLSATTTH